MSVTVPHYLLFTESSGQRPGRYRPGSHDTLSSTAGHWRFVLEAVDGSFRIEAEDVEPHVAGERLELLAVVRGLEALEQPSRVTLLSSSRYVHRGIRFGLENWRETQWQWESFGQMLPVKHRDLWERVDRALQIHQVACRSWMVKEEMDDERSCSAEAHSQLSHSPVTQHAPVSGGASTRASTRRRVRSSPATSRRVRTSARSPERWWHQVARLFGGELSRSPSMRLGA